MKRTLIVWMLAMAALAAPPGVLRTSITLQWDYPASELSTNLSFKIYSSTNLALSVANWPLLATVVGTNTQVTLPIDAQQRWYVATASNWWGESDFSNVAGTPPVPRHLINLGIGP